MKTFVCKSVQILLVLLIIATIAHAFYQSSLPPQKSVEESNKVGEIIEEIIPPDTKPGEYVQKNLRKLAHFTEFFALGLWCTLYVVLFYRRAGGFSLTVPFGMICALLDETVQIFSKRGASVKDVWIDVFGFFCAFLIVIFVFLCVLLIRRISRARRHCIR